jgi:hypothetical protein
MKNEIFKVQGSSSISVVMDEKSRNKASEREPKVYSLITTPEVGKLLKSRSKESYSLVVTFREKKDQIGKKSERFVALRVFMLISMLREIGFVCKRPIAQVTAHFPDSNSVHQCMLVKLEDIREKGLKHDSVCLVGKVSMIVYNFKILKLKFFKNEEWLVRLFNKKNCGQLLGNGETAKSKRRNGHTKSTISIEEGTDKPEEAGKKLSYHFLVDKKNRVSKADPSLPFVGKSEEKKAEEDDDFDT